MRRFRLAALVALLVAPAAFGQTPPYDRTILVGGSNTDLVNGNNLIAAVAFAGAAATPTDPWLVKVEPGIFDLGAQTLQMETFVDIEGSGRNATFIRSAGDAALSFRPTIDVASGVDAEIRNLTVQSEGDGNGSAIRNSSSELKATTLNLEVERSAIAIGFLSNDGSPRLSGVFPRVASKTSDAFGLDLRRGGAILNELFVFIDSDGGRNFGIRVRTDASPVIEQVSTFVTGSLRNNVGIRVVGATARITNTRVTSFGGTSRGTGIEIFANSSGVPGDAQIQETTVSIPSGDSTIIGFNLSESTATIQDTQAVLSTANPGSSTALLVRNGSVVEVTQSTLTGGRSVRLRSGSDGSFGTTQLDGTRTFDAGTTRVCASSYTGAYVAVAANCL